MRSPSSILTSGARAAYVHLPFCRRRCFYCDFPVVVVGDTPADSFADRYIRLLHREIAAGPEQQDGAAALTSVYFGGGTPSLTPPALLGRVIDALRKRFGLAPDCEMTLEMDPGTFDRERLEAFIDLGVTRVSLGAQSFDDALLHACNRPHSVSDTEVALELLMATQTLAEAPLEVSVDLIGGLPGQTMGSWRASLERAAGCGAGHVSVYDLQVEPLTAFGKWFDQGSLTLPGEEVAADMFRVASHTLRSHGFDHYEVSSYARPGKRCIHNRAYWRNAPFYAYGLGATSHIDQRRLARPRVMKQYEGFVDRLELSGWPAVQEADGLLETGQEALTTALMLSLRTDCGVDLDELRASYPDNGIGDAAAAACVAAASELPKEWISLQGIPTSGEDSNVSGGEDSNVKGGDGSDVIGGDGSDGDGHAASQAGGGRVVLSSPEGFLFSNEVRDSCHHHPHPHPHAPTAHHPPPTTRLYLHLLTWTTPHAPPIATLTTTLTPHPRTPVHTHRQLSVPSCARFVR